MMLTPLRLARIGALLCLAALAALTPTRRAAALPFVDIGPVAGTGFGIYMGSGTRDTTYIAGGLGARFDLLMIQLEAQVNYLSATVTGGEKSDVSFDASFLSLPVMARFDISPVPMLKLTIGGGFEHRQTLKQSKDVKLFSDAAEYIPVSLCADFKIPVVGAVGVEGRFSYMLSEPPAGSDKTHDLMVFAHFFF